MAPQMRLSGTPRANLSLLKRDLVYVSLSVHESKYGDMESFFKNIIIFSAGFVIALIIYNDPVGFNSKSTVVMDFETADSELSKNSKRPNSNVVKSFESSSNQRPSNFSKNLALNSMYNGYSSQPSLNDVPNIDERYAEQTPTEPPTGRPEEGVEGEETEETAENSETKPVETKEKFLPEKIAKDDKNSDSEKSLSSTLPIVGAVVAQNNVKTNIETQNPSRGSGGSIIRNPIVDVEPSDVVPDNFTQEGLTIAKRLFSTSSLSEAEYLEYLNLGLQSGNSSFSGLAVNELVALKSKNSFSLLTQYVSSSDSNLQSFYQSVESNYTTASDLRFLSEVIADDSSVISQDLAVRSLDVILNGDSMNFENQQVRDTLIQRVYPSLNRLSDSHPSYDIAREIASGISDLFSS